MKMFLLLIIVMALSVAGCAQLPPQWQYVHQLPFERSGNSYVTNYNGQTLSLITISNEFSLLSQEYKNGLAMDIFSTPEGEPVIAVINRFGVFKEKAVINLNRNSEFLIKESNGYNQKYYTVAKESDGHEMLVFFIVHSDASEGGYINSVVTYVEYLPHYYPLESWNPSVIDDRMDYINDFEKRAHAAIQFNEHNDRDNKSASYKQLATEKHKKKYTATQAIQSTGTIEERLKKLDALFYDKRIISKQEYEAKRAEILDGI